MKFTVTQAFTRPAAECAIAFTEPELYASFAGLPKVEVPEVVSRDEVGNRIRMRVRYRFAGDLNRAASAAVDRDRLTWIDESVHDRESLPRLAGLYDLVNVKLDKTGGLTEALALKREAETLGLGLMVGCMLGTSLAMAPAVLLAQGAAFVDLDGPLLLAEDRPEGLVFEGSTLQPPTAALWG